MASKFLKEALADRTPETKIFIKKYLGFVEKTQAFLEQQDALKEITVEHSENSTRPNVG